MNNGSSSAVCDPVASIIAEIKSEGAKFDRELRSVHREKIALPVDVIANESEISYGFTRNISEKGVCVVSVQQFELSKATLCLYRLGNRPARVLAECRWNRAYGSRYWLSGWQFQGLPRN